MEDLIKSIVRTEGGFGRVTLDLTLTILGVHVRRGDYIALGSTFGVLSLKYYTLALSRLDVSKFDRILVFSDDIDWCRESFEGIINADFIGSSNVQSIVETHLLMGMCNTLVCANSTFSISAALIHNVTNVIVPETIYMDASIRESITSPYPDHWIRKSSHWSSSP